jgi:CubicO group peptidase (beta-lactamase class C family)
MSHQTPHLPLVSPPKVGLSVPRLERICVAMEKQIAANRLAGGLGLIARKGKIACFETWGMADREAGIPMRQDAIFRIYSMTKAITGVAAMMLYEEGLFGLSDPVSNFLPEFASMRVAVERADPATAKMVLIGTVPADSPITMLDLMRHTSGLNYAGPHDENGDWTYRKSGIEAVGGPIPLDEMVKRLSQAPLVRQPGTAWDYGLSTDVLGRVVEVISGQSLDAFFAERIFKPLYMADTGFYVPESKWDRLATLYMPNPDGTIQRVPGGPQDSFRKPPVILNGGGGLTSTALDYAQFLQMLLNGGNLGDERLLSPKTVDLMRSNHLGDIPVIGGLLAAGHGFGLTFAVSLGPGRTGLLPPAGQYRWGGYAGTSFWIDPKEEMIGVFMIQILGDLTKRLQFQQLAYQAIVD